MASTAEVDLDLSARSFWAKPYEEREQTFAHLRANEPVSWHRPYESQLLPPDEETPGFWSLTKHEDIREVSRNAELFCSSRGILMEDFPELVQVASQSFLAMDAPRHTELRGIVKSAFTPRNVRKLEDSINAQASKLVDEMIDEGEGDFVELFAKKLPGRIFADFFGVGEEGEYREILMDAAERMLAWDDPEASQGRDALTTYAEEAERMSEIAYELADERRENPGDDLLTWVVQAEFEGERMDDWEVAAFFVLLSAAANDTTRHSTAHALDLLTRNPDQRAYLLEDLPGRVDATIEEILRYATPVMQFRRTATADTEIRGVEIAEGDKLVMWYCSGNRDEEVFDDPGRLDVSRDPNRHLGFGGGGAHYCMGAGLGRQMLKSALVDIYTRMPDIETGAMERQVNNFMHGVQALPARWTPAS